MTRIIDVLNNTTRGFSIEILPSMRESQDAEYEQYLSTIKEIIAHHPGFISVTYHQPHMQPVHQEHTKMIELHPKKLRDNPTDIAQILAEKNPDIPVAPHFICGQFTRAQTEEEISNLSKFIKNLMILRGDPNHGTVFTPHSQGYAHASDLLKHIVELRADLCLGVAAYPERHYAARNVQQGIEYLKLKEDLGASFSISQMCFDAYKIVRFRDQARQAGSNIEIIPGIKVIDNIKQLDGEKGLPARFNISIPQELSDTIDRYGVIDTGREWARKQIEILYENGFNNVHMYTSNKPKTIIPVLEGLGFLQKVV